MTPGTIPASPEVVTDPTEPDPTMPTDGEEAVHTVTHDVDTDDMFDPMAS